jgi:hypothetical protein
MSRALLLSFLLPLLVLADQSKPSQLPPAQYNGGDDNPPDPSDAGAEGSQKGAFNLSNGALVLSTSALHLQEMGGGGGGGGGTMPLARIGDRAAHKTPQRRRNGANGLPRHICLNAQEGGGGRRGVCLPTTISIFTRH